MSLIPTHRGFNRLFDEMSQDMMSRPFSPYWLKSNDALAVGNTTTDVVNNATKFGVSLDVSHFKPEEMKVHLDGRILTVEGHHELKDEHSHMTRSFTRKWTLPEDVELEKVATSLSKDGHLLIDAPKKNAIPSTRRDLPIEHHKK